MSGHCKKCGYTGGACLCDEEEASTNCDVCGTSMRTREGRTVQRCPECRDRYNKLFDIALAARLPIYSENWVKVVKEAETIAEVAMKSRRRDVKDGGRGV